MGAKESKQINVIVCRGMKGRGCGQMRKLKTVYSSSK